MRVSVSQNIQKPGGRGRIKFASLLFDILQQKYKVQVVDEHEKSDIHLLMIRGKMKPSCKNIVRIDGVYYDQKRMRMNNSIRKCISLVDGVVFQSKWSETFALGMLKIVPKSSTVIHNGTAFNDNSAPAYKHDFKKVFVCCSHWRVNKRLKSIVRAFLSTREENKDIGLFVVGDPDHTETHPNIKYFGVLQQQEMWSIYRSSDYMCHICHLDACPNSVVEGLSAGLPVLCNNIGGTPELVGDSGIVLPLDKPFNFVPILNMKSVGPKSVNQKILIQGMKQMMSKSWEVVRPDLDITVAAKKYYDYFVYVLEQ